MGLTINERFIDVDADAGGDGTTAALTGGTCAYKSLSIWEAARDADLTTGDGAGDYVVEKAVCGSAHASHTADTTNVTLADWTTSVNSYIQIETDASNRAGLSWDASKYRLTPSAAWSTALATQEDYVRVDGLQVGHGSSWGAGVTASAGVSAANEFRLSNCHIKVPAMNALYASGSNKVKAWNCLFRCASAVCVKGSDGAAVITLYSCTVISTDYGVQTAWGGTIVAKNCYVCGADGHVIAGTVTQTNCATSDASASGTDPLDNVACDADTFVNVTAGSEDFHLAADGLSPLEGAGVDTSGESAPFDFAVDIDGDARDATWDIGADAAVGGGPTEAVGTSSGVATVTGVAGLVPATRSIVTIAMADGARTGGELAFTVEATDASSENEAYTGAVRFAAQRKGAAVTCAVEDIGTEAITKSHAGADPTVTAVADVSSGVSVALKLTVDSALTPTSLKAHWHLTMLKGHGVIS